MDTTGIKTYKDWEAFARDKTKVSVYITPEQIYFQTPLEKELKAEQKVRNMFLEKGIEITRFRHNYKATRDEDYWGLIFHRTDSDVIERLEITALIGINARGIHGIETNNPGT